jgi:hypothetical protein
MTPKKRYDNKFFFTNVFHCCFWIRDPRSGIRVPGWVKIRIRDLGKTSRIRHTAVVNCYYLR